MTQGRGRIRELLESHGLKPDQRLGQNFLADPQLIDRIVRVAAVGVGDQVVEVGAGTGALTEALLATGARVVAYEIDERLRPILEDVAPGAEFRFEDATESLVDDLAGGSWVLVANLPYNVGTGIVLDVLQRAPSVARLVVMVQKEVADRLTASPGSRVYGLPSVIVSLYGSSHRAFTVPRDVFIPKPDVASAVVVIERTEPHPDAPDAVGLARVAFGQRRKMLRRSLAGVLDNPVEVLESAGCRSTQRAEELSPDDFLRIAAVAS
ncbi:MAG: 16S rRNA (adenine(1518)-N(6)/adenine(1519)-N(6))-dimethyltransferase RsmA [Acidimicrobiia bacterium]|nr:16S rRNA (adenine(1518)-N(6)/adenine(1519)-N(6))-dimethyltransferase RsmA [Acidimicrobiia bacterium]NNF68203.1 16S rRNA (adenine(1518)-N(6)/adenine(1519)-N(6))-dimethyltransferase RsmA [Acidimicrobiia bacterium]